MRWLVLDKIEEIRPGEYARSRSRIPAEAFSAQVLMIEMMAQTAGLLLGCEKDFSEDVVFTKIQSAEFQEGWSAGEEITVEASSSQLRPEGGWFDARVLCHAGVIARSRLMLMNVGHLVPGRKDSVTFHPTFMNHFQVRKYIKRQQDA